MQIGLLLLQKEQEDERHFSMLQAACFLLFSMFILASETFSYPASSYFSTSMSSRYSTYTVTL